MRAILMILLLVPSLALAGIGEDLQKHFNKWNMPANVTNPGAYHGQTSHYFTPGGLYLTQQDENYRLWHLQKPSASFGDCGEIDLFFGGLSFIDSDQFIDMAKSIGANAKGYLFSLALSQISPSIMSKIQELQAMGNSFNFNSINSCRMAKQLVDTGIGVVQDSMNKNCIYNAMRNSDVNGIAQARRACQKSDYMNAQNRALKNNPETAANVVTDTNLTWDAIQKNPILRQLDVETKYLLMSLVGTVVITTDNTVTYHGDGGKEVDSTHEPKITPYQSFLSDENLNRLSKHGKMKVWRCQGGSQSERMACLSPKVDEISIDQSQTFFGQIKTKLKNIENKVSKGNQEKPTEEELNELKGFLEVSIIPVYKILAVESAFSRGNHSLINIASYSDLISTELLYRFLDQGISEVLQGAANNQLPQKFQNELYRMALDARTRIEKMQSQNMERIRTVNDIITRVNMLEKQLMSSMSHNLAANLHWGEEA